jgi:hypothetical protein
MVRSLKKGWLARGFVVEDPHPFGKKKSRDLPQMQSRLTRALLVSSAGGKRAGRRWHFSSLAASGRKSQT